MTSNNHFFVYLPVNISDIVCKSMLFRIAFDISIWPLYTIKMIKNIVYTFKSNFWNTFFFSSKRSSWPGSCFWLLQVSLLPSWLTDELFKKSLYLMVSFVASFLVSFFDLLISKCKLKSIATFLASSKADKNLNISYLFLCSGIFLGISTLRHSTYLWASSFLMLRFQRSFAVPSLHWSCGCPLVRIPGTM